MISLMDPIIDSNCYSIVTRIVTMSSIHYPAILKNPAHTHKKKTGKNPAETISKNSKNINNTKKWPWDY